jgi:hypothetical protein
MSKDEAIDAELSRRVTIADVGDRTVVGVNDYELFDLLEDHFTEATNLAFRVRSDETADTGVGMYQFVFSSGVPLAKVKEALASLDPEELKGFLRTRGTGVP